MVLPVNEIERAAAEWAAKVDGGEMPADLRPAFDAWLAADPRHLGGYLKVEAALARVTRLGAEAQSRLDADTVVPLRAVNRRRWIMVGAIAACLTLVVAGGTVWKANSFAAAYETGIGEMRTVGLPDGSSITLNTGTRAEVHYSLWARDVTLDKGEALFDVAKNKARPFTVAAGDFSVRAVGTSFAVTRIEQRPLTVTVREGTVAISGSRVAGTTMVSAGSQAVASAGGVEVQPAQLSHDLAWLEGRVFFRRQTLAAAAHEFERYSSLRIVIADPAIASRTITGTYQANDPAGFAKVVAVLMDLRLETAGNKLYLRQKKA